MPCLPCLIPAAAKLLGHPKMRHAAAHFGITWPRYQLIGLAELAAASGIVIDLAVALTTVRFSG